MHAPRPIRTHAKKWRGMSLVFLALLPIFAAFHLVMWLGYTRTLFNQETGDLKRIGYLAGLEDCKEKLVAQEPKTGFTLLRGDSLAQAKDVPVMLFGDSFAASLAKAYSLRTQQPVGLASVDWEDGSGLAQVEEWVQDDWFQKHHVREIVVERVEYAWLDTFADPGDATFGPTWPEELAGQVQVPYKKATPWTFANNGNFKVVLCNLAYLFSPTAFKMTDTCVVRLKEKMFNCSYGNELLLSRRQARRAHARKRPAPRARAQAPARARRSLPRARPAPAPHRAAGEVVPLLRLGRAPVSIPTAKCSRRSRPAPRRLATSISSSASTASSRTASATSTFPTTRTGISPPHK